MHGRSAENVFVIRLRRSPSVGADEPAWRGSVHDVDSGRRFYVSSALDIAAFIADRMAERGGDGR